MLSQTKGFEAIIFAMYRSQINHTIKDAIKFFESRNFPLPPFAYWTISDWKKEKRSCQEIFTARLGWDVTDFGSGDFEKTGRIIFTLRNGKKGSSEYPKPYAQKLMYLKEEQKSAIHYHRIKMEDAINVGGGIIIYRFWKQDRNAHLSGAKLTVSVDGCKVTLKAGQRLSLAPGESVCTVPGMYHQFYAKKGSGPVMSMEVSGVCDDENDNFWLEKASRFPEIIEDEPRQFYLCSEYNKLFGFWRIKKKE